MSHALGRFHVAEPYRSLFRRHTYKGTPLKAVDWEPKVSVLDQEDLFKQGIDTSVIVPGAAKVDALGSCTANTAIEQLSNVLDEAAFLKFTGCSSYTDTKNAEIAAIKFYHGCTDLTHDVQDEYPPNDAGSSGTYVVQYMEQLKLCTKEQVATGATNVVSLLQSGGVMMGLPFLNAWMEPGSDGFIDGDGSAATLQEQIDQGVAGGHELFISAVEKLILLPSGEVDPTNTTFRFRNHWTASWGDNGSGRLHLSTLVALSNYCDFRSVSI